MWLSAAEIWGAWLRSLVSLITARIAESPEPSCFMIITPLVLCLCRACLPHTAPGGIRLEFGGGPHGRKWLVVASPAGELRVVDPATGARVHAVEAHPAQVLGLAIARNADSIVSGGADGLAHVWQVLNCQ